MQSNSTLKFKGLLLGLVSILLLLGNSQVYGINLTLQVNMSNETVDPTGVFLESSLAWGSPQAMTPIGGGVYSRTISVPDNATFQYKFKNGTTFEGSAGVACGLGANRIYTVGTVDETLPTVCFGGSCANCATSVTVTFRVNMSNVTVSGTGVFFESSLSWGNPVAMTSVGGGVYSVNITMATNQTIQYKFKNGTSFESNAQAGCNAGANRVYTSGSSSATLPIVCYNGFCSDCAAAPVAITFRVNMAFETVDPSGVFFESSLAWGNPVAMTLTSGSTYSVTVNMPANTTIQYKFKNGGNFEANAQPACGSGANRVYTSGTANQTLNTVCYNGSCTNCATTVNVTFRVNMSNVTVGGGGVNLETSLAWGAPQAMTNIGVGVYSVTLAVPLNTTFEYKFKNGTAFEGNAQAGCNAGANRVFTAGISDVTLPIVCYGGFCADCASASNVNVTFRVNMSNETIDPTGVFLESSLSWGSPLTMTSIGGNVYSVTVNAPVNTDIQYKFKNGPNFEGNAQLGCNAGANRFYNSGAADATLATVCYGGSCSNCVTNTNVTFNVNMSNETIDPSGVFLESSLSWGNPISMTDIGGSVYSATISIPSNTSIQYKFKNGSNFEANAEIGCNAGANRAFTSTTSDQTLATVCYGGSCTNCPTTIQVTFRVNMLLETVDPTGVFFASSLNGFSPVPMTLLSGTTYTVTVTAPVNGAIQYKFKNGPNFEANAQAACSLGANRVYSTGSSNSTVPTVCYGGSCADCSSNVNVTFQVNMAPNPPSGAVNLIHSLNGFADVPMTNLYDEVYSVTISAPINSTIQYKFKNGSTLETNADAGCASGANRVTFTGTSDLTLPVVCFGGLCTDCAGNVNLTISVNMFFETVDPAGVNLSTSIDGFESLIPMTLTGNNVYSVTIAAPSGLPINYKFRNGSNFEGDAQVGCNLGINRSFNTGFIDETLPTVCYGGSCTNCITDWTSVNSGPWNVGSTWDQGTPPPGTGVNVIISAGHVVTLNTNTVVRNLSIVSGGTLIADASPRSINLLDNGQFDNQGVFDSNGQVALVFNDNTSVSGNVSSQIVSINGGVTILNSLTALGLVQINSGGYFDGVIAPTYGPASTLRYSTASEYGRGLEWSSLSGAGFPHNVSIVSNTTLQLGANGGQSSPRALSGNLTIDLGSALYMDWGGLEMSRSLTIGGNLNLNGSLSMSNIIGGDISVRGNLTLGASSSFTANDRTLTLDGNTTQTILGSAFSLDLDYLILNNTTTVNSNLPLNIYNDITIGSGSSLTSNNDMLIQNGGTLFGNLFINPGYTLSVTGGTLISNGFLNMRSNASLLHGVGTPGGGGAVTGNVRIIRSGNGTGLWSYNYVSAPVQNALTTIMGVGQYYYDPFLGTDDVSDDEFDPGWIPAVGTMTNGQGYAANNFSSINFNGPANNGNINYNVVSAPLPNSKINLIGNPYPSPIDANAFLNTNGPSGSGRLAGAMYFWDDDFSTGSGYAVSDYAVWNGAGSVSSSSGVAPNGKIAVGQGFIVEANSSGGIVFQNSMRTNSPAIFFNNDEIQRVKLSVVAEGENYNETLIAFIDDATENRDLLYDATKIAGNPDLAFYSFLGSSKLAIQGLPPINESRIVNLGVQSTYAGNHIISLQNLENFPSSIAIYLEDLELNSIVNLRVSNSYLFYPAIMDLDSRFRIRFTAPITVTNVNAGCNSNLGSLNIDNPSSIDLAFTLLNSENQALVNEGAFNGVEYDINNLASGSYVLNMTMIDGYSFSTQVIIEGPQSVELFVATEGDSFYENTPIVFHAISNGATEWSILGGEYLGNGEVLTHTFTDAGIYHVLARSTFGSCAEESIITITVYEDNATSINTFTNENFMIVPNPAMSNTQILFSDKQKRDNINIRLIDSSGRIVLELNREVYPNYNMEIDLNNLSQGIYTVLITGETMNKSSRIIVN